MSLGNVHLTPQLVQAVRDAVDIVDIASEHTRLTPKGKNHGGLCPLHKEKTPSFSVDPTQGVFYCFGCGTGGDAIKLHMLLSGDDFPAAIESLALRYGIRFERGRGGAAAGPDTRAALAAAEEFFRDALARHPAPRSYLTERRIGDDLIERFRLGYAPDAWHELEQTLTRRVPLGDLVAAGLVGRRERDGKPYDRFRHRLMFPIHTATGRLVGFGGRTLGDDRAKYVNTSETEAFHKGSLLYGLDLAKRAIREHGQAVLVEGYFDVLAVAAAGEEGAVAGMGTSLTTAQARLLGRYADEVVVAFDGDAAGEEAHRRALPLLLAAGLAVRRARFGTGHDPDSLRLEAGPEAVAEAIAGAEDAVLCELERLAPGGEQTPRQQGRAAAAAGELLAVIRDPVERFAYARLAGERLAVPPELLLRGATGRRGRDRPPSPPEPAAARPAGSSLVRSLDEQVLGLLLAGGPELPVVAELPPPEIFRDAPCRNIYRLFCDLYRKEPQAPPDGKAVAAELTAESEAIDQLARVLIDSPSAPSEAGLPALLARLQRRWQQQQLRDLVREIALAQREGDGERLERLLREKQQLSQRLHRSS